jgi:hypothetical protein
VTQSRRAALATLCVALAPWLIHCGGDNPPTPWAGPVPKAQCGANDRKETALQGQTTLAERQSGASEQAYNCNLELVGQYQGEGAEWQLTWFNDCAYYGTYNNSSKVNKGTVVLDVSNPKTPTVTTYLTSAAMLDPWESLKVNPGRKLLGATKGPGFGASGPTDKQFAFYDLQNDCKNPTLLSDVSVAVHTGHAGDWAPDGQTYYGTGGGGFTAMNVADPINPTLIGHWAYRTHDISISEDGNRAYLAQQGNFVPFGLTTTTFNGLVILDTSEIQTRKANAQPKLVSTLFWEDGGVAQQTIPVTYNGKKYLIFTDETGAGPLQSPSAGRAEACARGLAPFGFARIIDINDETRPMTVSKLMLEANDPANCAQFLGDFPDATKDNDTYGYSSHYCTPDATKDPKMLACSYWGAGIRVFDIRDPYRPKEIAYYKPGAKRTQVLYGSSVWNDYGGKDRTTDRVGSNIRFHTYNGENHLWFIGQDNGFMVVKFTKPFSELLR